MQIDRSAGAEDEGGAWRPTERCAGRVDDSEIEQMPSDLLDATSLLTPAVLRAPRGLDPDGRLAACGGIPASRRER